MTAAKTRAFGTTTPHTCNGDIAELEDLIDGYLPLPYDYMARVTQLRKEKRTMSSDPRPD